jgi:hypothetical protein
MTSGVVGPAASVALAPEPIWYGVAVALGGAVTVGRGANVAAIVGAGLGVDVTVGGAGGVGFAALVAVAAIDTAVAAPAAVAPEAVAVAAGLGDEQAATSVSMMPPTASCLRLCFTPIPLWPM